MSIKLNQIIDNSMNEFAKYSYEEASINRICTDNSMTKGQLYHYFKSKEELYLSCLKKVYDEIEEFHKTRIVLNSELEKSIETYFDIRFQFFKEYPVYSQVFFQTINRKSKDLKDEISLITKPFRDFNVQYFKNLLSDEKLIEGLELDVIINFYVMVFESYNVSLDIENPLFLETYQKETKQLVVMMLYGTLEREV